MVLHIDLYTTNYRVSCNKTNALLTNGISILPFLNSNLEETEYDPNRNRTRVVARYNAYDDTAGQLILPINTYPAFKQYIQSYGYNYVTLEENHVQPWECTEVDIPLAKDICLRDGQLEMIDFLTDPHKLFKPLSAQTGTGKTLSAIYAASVLGHPTMIILPMLIQQWHREILKFTQLTKDEIYIVQGYPSLAKLWNTYFDDSREKPKIFLVSTRTLINYCYNPVEPYSTDIPPYQDFCTVFGIGTKIIDETHLNFLSNVQIDLHSNVLHNIYLSATYQRASITGRKCFDAIYPKELRYGEERIDRYTRVYMVRYSLVIPVSEQAYFKRSQGYQHTLYEKYLLHHSQFQNYYGGVIRPLLLTYYFQVRKIEQRCLIIVSMQETAIAIYKALFKDIQEQGIPIASTAVYLSGNTDEYGRPENLEADIIVSTMKSCGTGRDIANLKTCINTVSFASSPQAQQLVGRLRKLPGDTTIFVDIWNKNVSSHYFHQRNRRNAYASRVATITNVFYD